MSVIFSKWCVNEGPKILILGLWYLVNFILFIVTFFKYYRGDGFFYHIQMLGMALPFARASAMCLNFNCMLLLFPICRNLVSHIRHLCITTRILKRNIRRLLDKNITFHKAVAQMICVHTAIHIAAHCFNLEYFVKAQTGMSDLSKNFSKSGLLSRLSLLSNGSSIMNPVRHPHADCTAEMFKLLAGVTGVLATFTLILIVSSSTEIIRRSYFEVFWVNHHLFVVFYLAIIFHGFQGVVKPQVNLNLHDPKICYKEYRNWGKTANCPEPYFQSGGPNTWKWLLVPCVVYLLERALRLLRSFQTVEITEVVLHHSRVIELRMKRRGFSALPGQYVFLQCPEISRLEWHPFTLTSAPQDDFFGVHIRCLGDWTDKLKELFEPQPEPDPSRETPRIYVDGPFGTATEDTMQYNVDIMIGTGIGITPFASVLKDIWYQLSVPNGETDWKLKKIYFFWLCPDYKAFEWFGDLLLRLETQMLDLPQFQDFLEYKIYLTRGWDDSQAHQLAAAEVQGVQRDPLTGLRSKTHFGRPQWEHVWESVSAAHFGASVGVFLCGPKVLSTELHTLCNQFSSSERNGTKFFYNKENF